MFCQLNEQEDERFEAYGSASWYYTLKSQYNVSRRELVYYNPFLKDLYIYITFMEEKFNSKKDC